MKRREFITLLGGVAVAWPLRARAQQAGKVARIGFLGSATAAGSAKSVEAFRTGLRDLGYVEGKNIVIEFQWAEGKYERLPALLAELIRRNVDVLVTHGTPGIRAAKQATTTIPIVMAVSGDAVATGLIASLNQPSGNITGSTFFNPELCAKRLEILKETLPRAKRVALLLNPDNLMNAPNLQATELTAKSLMFDLQQFEARRPDEFENAFSAMVTKGVDAVALIDDPMLIANIKVIADLASKRRLPSIGFLELAETGGLVGYGVNFAETFHRAAYFVDRILKGAKPPDLPVERATKFVLIINREAAKALGLTIPQSMLARADKVI